MGWTLSDGPGEDVDDRLFMAADETDKATFRRSRRHRRAERGGNHPRGEAAAHAAIAALTERAPR